MAGQKPRRAQVISATKIQNSRKPLDNMINIAMQMVETPKEQSRERPGLRMTRAKRARVFWRGARNYLFRIRHEFLEVLTFVLTVQKETVG
jgi:hypothetical protein